VIRMVMNFAIIFFLYSVISSVRYWFVFVSNDFSRQLRVLLKWAVSNWLRMELLPLHWIPDITESLLVAKGFLSFLTIFFRCFSFDNNILALFLIFALYVITFFWTIIFLKRIHLHNFVVVVKWWSTTCWRTALIYKLLPFLIGESMRMVHRPDIFVFSQLCTHIYGHDVFVCIELWTRYGASVSVTMDSRRKSFGGWIQKTWHFVMVNSRMSIALHNSHSPNSKWFDFETTARFLWNFV
jgi:hypothetical protein